MASMQTKVQVIIIPEVHTKDGLELIDELRNSNRNRRKNVRGSKN